MFNLFPFDLVFRPRVHDFAFMYIGSFIFCLQIFLFVCLKGRVTERALVFTGSLCKCTWSELRPDLCQEAGILPWSPTWELRSKHLGCLLLFKVHEQEAGLV